MKVSFKVAPHLSSWSSDFGEFPSPSVHEVSVDKVGVELIAAAESAGSLIEVEYDGTAAKTAANAVEADEDSLSKLQSAMEPYDESTGSPTGPWLEGHLINVGLDQAAKAEEDNS